MVSADVANPAVVEQLTEYVRVLGPVDVLVNCAGITHTATMANTSVETYQVKGRKTSKEIQREILSLDFKLPCL